MMKLKKNRERAQYYLEKVKTKISDIEEIISLVEDIKERILLNKNKVKEFLEYLAKIANEEEI